MVVTDPAHVREVFLAPHDMLSAGEASEIFEPFVGRGSLFLLDGPMHARHRRLLSGPLREGRMQEYFDVIVDSVDRMTARYAGAEIAFYGAARTMTLEVLVRVLFGPSGAAALEELGARARAMVDICAKPLLMIPAARVDLGRWSPWGRVLRTMRELDRRIYAAIAELRSVPANGTVLSLLLAARDEDGRPLSDTELRDELVTLLIAGNETTATALAWTIDELHRAPHVLERVRAELVRVGPLSAEKLDALPELDACVREALRLHPPIANTIRVVKRPFRLGPWELPPGAEVAPCMHLAHRDPELFPDPLSYRPERFRGTRIDPYAFFPFGGGSRRCMGMSLALFETKVALARLLTTHSFTHASRRRPRARRRALLMAPDTGVPLRVERREGR